MTTLQERRDAARKHSEAVAAWHRLKLQAGPDHTEAALANSPYPESSLMRMHESHKVDLDGKPALREALIRYFDGTSQEQDDRHVRQAMFELKGMHSRAYGMMADMMAGMSQRAIASAAGCSQTTACRVLHTAVVWLERRITELERP